MGEPRREVKMQPIPSQETSEPESLFNDDVNFKAVNLRNTLEQRQREREEAATSEVGSNPTRIRDNVRSFPSQTRVENARSLPFSPEEAATTVVHIDSARRRLAATETHVDTAVRVEQYLNTKINNRRADSAFVPLYSLDTALRVINKLEAACHAKLTQTGNHDKLFNELENDPDVERFMPDGIILNALSDLTDTHVLSEDLAFIRELKIRLQVEQNENYSKSVTGR